MILNVFKIISSAGTPVGYDEIFTLQNQIKDDLRRVCIDQEPLSQVFQDRSLAISEEQTKRQNIKLKVKLIGRAIKVETHDLLGTFMTLPGVFLEFKMVIASSTI